MSAAAPLLQIFKRPLVTIETLMVCLDKNEDQVLSMVEEGKLFPFCYDIRSRTASRRCLRIFAGEATGPDSVFAAVFPGRGDTIPASRIARRLTCSSQHVLDLIKEGLLKRQPGRIGPTESPTVSRKSICEFLNSRRVC